MLTRSILLGFLILAVRAAGAASGEAVYQKRCAGCHDAASERAPSRDALKELSVARILRTLDFGVMINVAYPLSREEREAVAKYLGVDRPDAPAPAQAFCSDRTVTIGASPTPAWKGWGPDLSNTRYTTASGISLNQAGKLKLKWAYAYAGDVSAFAAPTVLGKTLFVGSAGGAVQALSTDTGCVRWLYQASGPVRSAPVAVPNGAKHVLVFTDLTGWVYGIEAETGTQLWKKKVEQHDTTRLTGTAAVLNGTVFVPAASWEETRSSNPEYACCTFRGSITALRAKDGTQIWKTYTIRETPAEHGKTPNGVGTWGPSGAGVWGSPTIDNKRGLLYIATGDNFSSPASDMSDAVLALDIKNGRIVWSKQVTPGDVFSGACTGSTCPGPDHDVGSSVLIEKLPNGRDVLLAGQKSGVVFALDPDRKGEILWQTRVGKGGTNGGVQWGMASDGKQVYAAVSDVVRKASPGAVIQVGLPLDPTQGGGLTALRIGTGEKAWYAAPGKCSDKPGCSPAQPSAVTAIPGVVFSGSVDGHLRAFATEDGRVLWDFDTAREYKTVNGVPGKGGSLDGAGPVAVGGMLFVNSGYARNGGMAGNVLLAFAPEE
ncbi:MAG: PQQ-binding-like beta-propeller repeat protein [Bryobacterales bacterium]|nr:PQQ-binding-like beta-propeller repeat protein [Bryobacterales bacterium]MBV9398480.1 PQQ-binding-like beta-propeller repeat protein [Bryobacterales bacterium]